MVWKQYLCGTDIIDREKKNDVNKKKKIIIELEWEWIVKYEILLPNDSLVHVVRCGAPSRIQTEFIRVTLGSEVRVFHILFGLSSPQPLTLFSFTLYVSYVLLFISTLVEYMNISLILQILIYC